ncbi:hypothetical protein [Streptomyces melanogenes]|uniref:hypothetical protein n=1 Tax=Streptomyces melanogenes TaxID=67326 RepID=UPI0037AE9BE6
MQHRQEALKAEALEAPVQGPKCALSGAWSAPYDGQYFDDARKHDIGHLVSVTASG